MPKVIASEIEILHVQCLLGYTKFFILSHNSYTCDRNWWEQTVKLCLIVDQEICHCTYLILGWNYDESQLREKLLCT